MKLQRIGNRWHR